MVAPLQRIRTWRDSMKSAGFASASRAHIAAGLTAMTVAITVAMAALLGQGNQLNDLIETGGGAWLSSPDLGYVTLIDGPSEQVVATIRAPSKGSGLSVTQSGTSAYVADDTTGTVSRINGATYLPSSPVPMAAANSDLSVESGSGVAYVIDATARVATAADPVSLAVRSRISLSARPGTQQTLVDGDRLWVLDAEGAGVAWFGAGGERGQFPADRRARLVSVDGTATLVDLSAPRPKISALTEDGLGESWPCHLDTRADDTVQVLGSVSGGRVYAAVDQTGGLVVADRDGAACGDIVPLSAPGARFGPIAQSAHFLFIPDARTGRAAVVDTTSNRMVADLEVVAPGHTLELLAKDGQVFYNDLNSEKAGVLRLDSRGVWVVGRAIEKFNPKTKQPLVVGPIAPNPTPTPSTSPSSPSSTPTSTPSSTPSPSVPTPSVRTPTSSPSTTPPGETSNLEIDLYGSGSGTVRATYPGDTFTCPPTCSRRLAVGTQVTLRVRPAADSFFASWAGAVGCAWNANPCVVEMQQFDEIPPDRFPIGVQLKLESDREVQTLDVDPMVVDLTGGVDSATLSALVAGDRTGRETIKAASLVDHLRVALVERDGTRAATFAVSVAPGEAVPEGRIDDAIRLTLSLDGSRLDQKTIAVVTEAVPKVVDWFCSSTPGSEAFSAVVDPSDDLFDVAVDLFGAGGQRLSGGPLSYDYSIEESTAAVWTWPAGSPVFAGVTRFTVTASSRSTGQSTGPFTKTFSACPRSE